MSDPTKQSLPNTHLHVQLHFFFFTPSPLPFGRIYGLLTRGPAGNRTTTGSLSATQECRDTNCTARTGRPLGLFECRGTSFSHVFESDTGSNHCVLWECFCLFFPSNAFMASAHRYTHSKVYMQGCHLSKAIKVPFRTSTQSRSCPRKKIDKKANQKQQSKQKRQKTHNHNTNQTKTTERMGSPPAMGITCMMTSYVSFL